MKKSGFVPFGSKKGENPFAKKKPKKFAEGGLVNSDLKSMGRNMAKAKNQK